MQNAINSLENNALAALTQRAPTNVVNAIQNASRKTGVSFSYLLEKAAAESSFQIDAKARTSSATGLFQFIERTWLDMVNKHGEKHGINPNQSREQLLNLRNDPKAASMMAAEFAQENKNYLEKNIKSEIGDTELYFAHFMGARGASAFLSQLEKNPDAIAAHIFPKEARANRNVFYDSQTGYEKTLQQVYEFFDKKFSNIGTSETIETPLRRKSGYQHITFSLKEPTTVLPLRPQASILSSFVDDYFETRRTITNSGMSPIDFYSKITNPSAMLIDLLK
ncbi:MAG: transglycosylase SLT domain-containing protein [Pseudomonadota bacterium]